MDLLTVFRRKSTFARPRRSIYHAVPPSEKNRSQAEKDFEVGGVIKRDSIGSVNVHRN